VGGEGKAISIIKGSAFKTGGAPFMLIMLGQKKKASPEIGNAFYFLIMSIEFSIFNSQFSIFNSLQRDCATWASICTSTTLCALLGIN
jgi:hypothetical protein